MTLRELLNEHKWHRGDLAALRVVVAHRGAPGGEREIPGKDIREVRAQGLLVEPVADIDAPDDIADGSVFVPYHRVLRVLGPQGTLWTKTS